MNVARYPKTPDEPSCPRCHHTNEYGKQGKCTAVTETGPCGCKAHILSVDRRRLMSLLDREVQNGTKQ